MLTLVDDRTAVAAAQRLLMATLRGGMTERGPRNIGYPGGNSTHPVWSRRAGGLYYAYSEPRNQTGIARHWNSFGIYHEGARPLQIAVEINVPRDGPDARVGGFFARDEASGTVFLLHSGAIGGGRPGVSQAGFLRAIADRPVPVAAGRRIRRGLVIGAIDDPQLVGAVERFVRLVAAFKEAVTGNAPPPDRGDAPDEAAWIAEFHGWKRGTRTPVFDYFSYHGMIVDALYEERSGTASAAGEHVGRDRLTDLFVTRGGQRTDVFEVKTSAGRQSLYTAIGQLMVHGGGDAIRRWLVIPDREPLPRDCARALAALAIQIRRYRIVGTATTARIRLV